MLLLRHYYLALIRADQRQHVRARSPLSGRRVCASWARVHTFWWWWW
jgi:hypothetical protein